MALLKRGIHFGSYGTVDDGPAVFDRVAKAAQVAETSGFDALSLPDHVVQNRIGGGPSSPMFEAYTLLGALATQTTSAWLYALVSPVTMRNPASLAKAVTTLDVLSGGRAMLGLGAGWDEAEHAAYGVAFPPVGERMDRLDEALSICRALFGEQQASFTGAHYAIHQAWNSPRPVNRRIPVLVGGGGERRTLDLVARHADACNVSGDPATVAHKFEVLEEHCRRVGREPSEITRTVFLLPPDDLGEFRDRLGALKDVGAEGAVVIAGDDPERIPAVGRVLVEVFPD